MWNVRYICDRLRLMVYETRYPDHPWLNQNAIALLAEWLHSEHRGLEFGSGRSTMWIAKRVKHLTSVESNPQWHSHVTEQLAASGTNNVDYHFFSDEDSYVGIANRFNSDELDFVIVDGAFDRARCALEAVKKIRPGGMLVIDNSSWFIPSTSRSPLSRSTSQGPASELWGQVLDYVKNWKSVWTENGIPYKDTAFYFRQPNEVSCGFVSVDRVGDMSSHGCS